MPNAANVSFDVRGGRDSTAIAILEREDRKLFRGMRLRLRDGLERRVGIVRVRHAAPNNSNALHAPAQKSRRQRAKDDNTERPQSVRLLCQNQEPD